jgi:hypothetical protein
MKPAYTSGIKKQEYLKDKLNELTTNSRNKIRDFFLGINEFKRGYQPRNNVVKDENGDLLTDSHSIKIGGNTTFLSY